MLSLGGRVCLFNDSGVDALMGFLAEAGTKVYHHGGVKKVILLKLRQAEKELKVGVFANLLRSLFVSGAKSLSLMMREPKATRPGRAQRPIPVPARLSA